MAGTTAVFRVKSSENMEVPLMKFSNGRLKENHHVSDMRIRCFHSDSIDVGVKRKRSKKILVAESKRVQYTGYNYGPNATKTGGICRFLVGIHNKREGTLSVVPASLFTMKPTFNSDEDTQDADISNREKRDYLTTAFGSKKKRRAVDSRGSEQVHEDSLQVSAAAILQEASVDNTPASKAPVSEQSQPEAIPPRDDQAKVPANVYKIDAIISKEEYSALLGLAGELCEADKETIVKWKTECRFSSYVLSWLRHLPVSSDDKMKTCVLLLYYQHMVNLLTLRFADLRKKDPLPTVAEPLKSSILGKFTLKSTGQTGKVSRTMPQRLKDKAVAYALVLALHIENFTLDLASVQCDFKVPLNRLITICYALGCYVLSRKNTDGGQTKVIELRLPLFVMNDKGARMTKRK